jgi:hypothetical protein
MESDCHLERRPGKAGVLVTTSFSRGMAAISGPVIVRSLLNRESRGIES